MKRFRANCSLLLEVKTSRADFLADRLKPERSGHRRGVGLYRAYLCPEGLLSVNDLPARWGLLYATGNRVIPVHMPRGNAWPSAGADVATNWTDFQHLVDEHAERGLLYSVARRLSGACKQRKPPCQCLRATSVR